MSADFTPILRAGQTYHFHMVNGSYYIGTVLAVETASNVLRIQWLVETSPFNGKAFEARGEVLLNNSAISSVRQA